MTLSLIAGAGLMTISVILYYVIWMVTASSMIYLAEDVGINILKIGSIMLIITSAKEQYFK